MDHMDISSLSLVSKPTKKNGKVSWPQASAMKQINFSLTDSVIYYISKNPSSPEIYLKLAKSCKYFFEIHPLIIVASIRWGIIICSNDIISCIKNDGKCCLKVGIKKLSSKIWLTDRLGLWQIYLPNFVPLVVSKIYRCENADLSFSDTFTLKHFQLLASKFQKFKLTYVKMIDSNGNVMMLDKIFELIPNVTEFNYEFGYESPAAIPSTMKNISKLQNLDNLCYIRLQNIPDVININDLSEFIKKQQNTKFWLSFNVNISAEYKNKLSQLVDNVIASQIVDCVIRYNGQDQQKLKILESRCTALHILQYSF